MKDRTVPPSWQDYGEKIILITAGLIITVLALIGVEATITRHAPAPAPAVAVDITELPPCPRDHRGISWNRRDDGSCPDVD